MYPIRCKEGLTFQIKSAESKITFQRWNDETKKYETAQTWLKGYNPKFIFELVNGEQLEVSKDQLSQMLFSAYMEKKKMADLKYFVKTNGKTGKEIKYWINVARDIDPEVQQTVEGM
jgi:hypothetical protein